MTTLWHRLRRHSPRDYAILAEATLAIALSALLISFVRFRLIAAVAARAPRRLPATATNIPRLQWAVAAAARRAPWRAKCFEKGLAMQAMLRRRGIAATLHYGVARSAGDGVIAHVWVTAGTYRIVGGENADDFAEIARFPGNIATGKG